MHRPLSLLLPPPSLSSFSSYSFFCVWSISLRCLSLIIPINVSSSSTFPLFSFFLIHFHFLIIDSCCVRVIRLFIICLYENPSRIFIGVMICLRLRFLTLVSSLSYPHFYPHQIILIIIHFLSLSYEYHPLVLFPSY